MCVPYHVTLDVLYHRWDRYFWGGKRAVVNLRSSWRLKGPLVGPVGQAPTQWNDEGDVGYWLHFSFFLCIKRFIFYCGIEKQRTKKNAFGLGRKEVAFAVDVVYFLFNDTTYHFVRPIVETCLLLSITCLHSVTRNRVWTVKEKWLFNRYYYVSTNIPLYLQRLAFKIAILTFLWKEWRVYSLV